MNGALTIGRVSKAADCKVQTIRYYEDIGLIPPPARSEGNQRIYDPGQIERLRFIRHARELGFSLDAIRDLLSLADDPDRSCEAADVIAKEQLVEVERRIGRLRSLKAELQRMIEQCSGGRIADCRVIRVLGDRDQCATDHRDQDSSSALTNKK